MLGRFFCRSRPSGRAPWGRRPGWGSGPDDNVENDQEPHAEVHGRWPTLAIHSAPHGNSSLDRDRSLAGHLVVAVGCVSAGIV